MTRHALIVAGGKGSRMLSELPKQFMLLLDIPVLMHTIERFALADESMDIVLVLPEDQIPYWKSLCAQMDFDVPHRIVVGGKERFDSVKSGLEVIEGEGVVAIHDGVRPLISPELIQRCYEQAEANGSALPVVQISQSLRRVRDGQSEPLDRTGVVAVQTPQCFSLNLIKSAYLQAFKPSFTDDATVYETAGNKIYLVDGEETNIKITTPADLKIAEAILRKSGSRK